MDGAELDGRLCPARPEEAPESKPKSQETPDDGYETSNSGDALRRKPTPELDRMPPPEAPPEPYDLHRPEPYPPLYPRQLPTYPHPLNHQPFPLKRDYDDPENYYRREDYFKTSYNQPELYGYVKREPEVPYDMSQHQFMKREHEEYNGGMIKREIEDPYSFVEEDPMCGMMQPPQQAPMAHHMQHPHMMHPQQMMLNQPKKRGRKKKIKDENGMEIKVEGGIETLVPRPVKERKKHDRFNGMSEEEVSRRTLPDHLTQNLDIIIIGINPGLFAAYKGHHYAGPGNHFWKCLYLSGLTREQMSADEDYKLMNFGIGFTNMVPRATKGSADLTRREIKEGSVVLLEKLQTFRPKVAVFNGKLIYEVFSGKKDFCFGKQPDPVAGTNTYMWVMPSSSARCAQLPRAADKVPFYAALKKFRDYLNGLVPHVDDSELVFPDNTTRRPQEELEIRRNAAGSQTEDSSMPHSSHSTISKKRLTMEPEPGDTIILEDGTEVPLKKKRGRPKKIKLENGEIAPPIPRAPRQPRAPQSLDPNDQPTKKKRGRPKKIRPEEQQFILQQQQQQQQQQQNQIIPQQIATLNLNNPAVDTQYSLHQPAPDYQQSTNLTEQIQNNIMYNQGNLVQPTETWGVNNVQNVTPIGYAASPNSFSQSPRPNFGSPRARSPLHVSYTPSPAHTPYSQHSSPATTANRTPAYAPSPVLNRVRNDFNSELPAELGPISPQGSPSMGHIDFEPPIAANKIRVPDAASLDSQDSPMGSTDMHPGSNSNSSLSDFNKPSSAGPSELSPSLANNSVGTYSMYEDRMYMSPDKREHYHYPEQVATSSVGVPAIGSPRLEQLHPPIYPNSYNRSTPPGVGSPYSPHYRPPEHPPHTPGSPGEYPTKPKPQDVASKSLSGLESLVDQIPSIAEGNDPAPPPEPYPIYPPYYANNGYAPPLVGYGTGWPYIPEWQYNYPQHYPYYHPPPQQYLPHVNHHLSLDLHKTQDPAVPSVGFGGFC